MFQKQPMMRRVLYALAPITALAIWLYGPRVLATLAVSLGVGVSVEYLFERRRGGKVSEAVLVTGTLFALSMPPAAPLWIVAVGVAFAVFMAKEVYGGFGRNVFNPAIAGRLFVYISFAGALGGSFFDREASAPPRAACSDALTPCRRPPRSRSCAQAVPYRRWTCCSVRARAPSASPAPR